MADRLFVFWVMAWLAFPSESRAEGQEPPAFINTSGAPLEGVRVGDMTLATMAPGAVVELDNADTPIIGRFALSRWADASESEEWVTFHLRTAGFYLDGANPGLPGDPTSSANLIALRELKATTLDSWSTMTQFRRALLTYAARHTNPGFVASLLKKIGPDTSASGSKLLPKEFGSVPDNLRIAVETQGAEDVILSALIQAPRWARDRGLIDQAQFAALGVDTINLDSLPSTDKAVVELTEAIRLGDEERAQSLAARYAVSAGSQSRSSVLTRMSCSVLDSAAADARRRAQWIATEAYLMAALRLCGDLDTLRERISQYYRARAEAAVGRLDLTTATDWLTGAYQTSRKPIDRAFLADTLAELALLRFRTEDAYRGKTYLARARALDPFRERVIAAGEHDPETDPRARVGVAIVIFFLAIFAWRRLRRALFGDIRRI
ncbi:MAG: hypothetical protein ACON3Z_16265 [Bradymonadia bacterium]